MTAEDFDIKIESNNNEFPDNMGIVCTTTPFCWWRGSGEGGDENLLPDFQKGGAWQDLNF